MAGETGGRSGAWSRRKILSWPLMRNCGRKDEGMALDASRCACDVVAHRYALAAHPGLQARIALEEGDMLARASLMR